ncbi:phage Gp37/Gp68 family protein [Marinobacter pelagius]|uniref:Protein gp37 n=1 Tax=Marinobacter pelagius TaxID=379482 RepID=A0A1I4T6Z1_9GAMM|nr:phage Gp37/Gp68 family protein [Marinobacter pelagius]SFM72337.1 protein gp37 [Marinobacter pelagius]
MGLKTGIEWTESTWNPIRGCSRVSEGCRNCYAETVAKRFSSPGQPYEGLIAKGGQWNGQVSLVEHKLDEPCRWTKPRRIFVNSMSDLFHPDVSFEEIAGIFGIMAAASWHTFQVLTKRPERMLEFFQWIDDHPERPLFDSKQLQQKFPDHDWRPFFLADKASQILPSKGESLRVELRDGWPLKNVWLGVSVEDQATANERIPLLLSAPAAVRWISAEPLLGSVMLRPFLKRGDHELREMDPMAAAMLSQGEQEGSAWVRPAIDWVVVGGESGTNARPMHPDWARTLRDQCQEAGVPFLFKQWGEFAPSPDGGLPDDLPDSAGYYFDPPHPPGKTWRFGKKRAGRLLDGETWNQYPGVDQ